MGELKGLSRTSSIVAGLLTSPFQIHSLIVPPLLMVVGKSSRDGVRGVVLTRASASIRLDLPEPFVPIRTLRFFNSREGLPEANESRLSSLML